jgi:hypothetical protein
MRAASHEPLKDPHEQQPIAKAWRPTLRAIVAALAEGDYELARGISGVTLQWEGAPRQMRDYVRGYGQTLTALPEASWETSVAQWIDPHWDVFVDLWTVESGCSDMVLHLQVLEMGDGFRFEIYMIYVP